MRQHRGSSLRRFCSPDHAREYWLRVDLGVRPRRHRMLRCPVCGKMQRMRAEAVYCSASGRVKAWRKRQHAAAEAQPHAEAEA